MTNPITDKHEAGVTLSAEDKLRRDRRSKAIGIALAALVLLFFALTVVKLGPAVLDRPL